MTDLPAWWHEGSPELFDICEREGCGMERGLHPTETCALFYMNPMGTGHGKAEPLGDEPYLHLVQ